MRNTAMRDYISDEVMLDHELSIQSKEDIKEVQINMMFEERQRPLYQNGHPEAMSNKAWRNFEKQFGYGKTKRDYCNECDLEIMDYENGKKPRKVPVEFFDTTTYVLNDPSSLLDKTRVIPKTIPRVWNMYFDFYF